MFTSLRRGAGVLVVGGALAMLRPVRLWPLTSMPNSTGRGLGGFGVITLGVPTEAAKPATTKVAGAYPRRHTDADGAPTAVGGLDR